MKMNLLIGLSALICVSSAAASLAADFDGDGVGDEFTITRDAAKAAAETGVRLTNPWAEVMRSKRSPKGLGIIIGLTRTKQTYLLHDAGFFSSPMWLEAKPPVEVIAKKDGRYRDWKRQVPALQSDAIQIGTEAGIDILLYWNGKEWRLFWPDEEP